MAGLDACRGNREESPFGCIDVWSLPVTVLPPLAVRMTSVGRHTCDWVVTHKIPPLELDTLRGEEEGEG